MSKLIPSESFASLATGPIGAVVDQFLFRGGLLSMKLGALQKVDRYAIVGAPTWMKRFIEAVNPAFEGIDIRTFSLKEEEEAWKWLQARPQREISASSERARELRSQQRDDSGGGIPHGH